MKVITGLSLADSSPPYPVLTIGNFDGVHLGHQALIHAVVERARHNRGTAVVMTFDPHPLKVLAPARAPRLIQTPQQHERSLRAQGIELLWVIPFTLEVSNITARDFVVEILAGRLGVRELFVGQHFLFGHDRKGNIDLLRELGAGLGFQVKEVDELRFRGFRISSTRIRQFLEEGRVGLAARVLGQPAALQGRIVEGAGRGTPLGIPTANLEPANEWLPRTGVYLTTTRWRDRCYPGLTNVGYRPTMTRPAEQQNRPVVETHLLDFSGNLYGQELELLFHCRLRGEKRFASPQELVAQITRDKASARRYFRRRERVERQKVNT